MRILTVLVTQQKLQGLAHAVGPQASPSEALVAADPPVSGINGSYPSDQPTASPRSPTVLAIHSTAQSSSRSSEDQNSCEQGSQW